MNSISFILAITAVNQAYTWDLPEVHADNFTENNFNNYLDHFNFQDDKKFEQRYFECDDFFDKDNGPLFLYICGESECSVKDTLMFPFMIGAKHKAKLVALEHRFYGKSIPNLNLKLSNLHYLTAEQALADIAFFITKMNKDKPDRQVVVIGGSYPGALSAWFREKYPHLAVASWSSSGVVYPIKDFWQFDQQIYDSTLRSGVDCPNTVIEIQNQVATTFKNGTADDIKNMMEAMNATTDMDHGDFAYYFSDIFVASVQYGNRTGLCKVMDEVKEIKDFQEQLKHLLTHANSTGVKPADYDRKLLVLDNITAQASARSWTYQYCSEFGWYQTPSHNADQAMRPTSWLNETYWQEMCSYIFPGVDTEAGIKRATSEFSFHHTAGSNTLIINGIEDPWQWAAERVPNANINQIGLMVDCDHCGHCVDLHTPKDADSDSLVAVQGQIIQWLDNILTVPEDNTEYIEKDLSIMVPEKQSFLQ